MRIGAPVEERVQRVKVQMGEGHGGAASVERRSTLPPARVPGSTEISKLTLQPGDDECRLISVHTPEAASTAENASITGCVDWVATNTAKKPSCESLMSALSLKNSTRPARAACR